ncbi:MAG TPA: SDR family oxidoreductase [Candidatus Dormibacteraeota bacterium]|nr:SDR family oxidoreductase [Candidatus Dormibacteraeota bacterium]
MTAQGALSGKVGVVSGAGSGVGRSVALALARQGASVVVADFDSPRLERTVEDVLRLSSAEKALSLTTDVRDDASVRSLARSAMKAMGRVDIVINAAGVLLQGRIDKISTHDWTWMLETNLLGAVRTSLAFLPYLTEQRSGHVINIVAYGGLHPGNPQTIPYDAGHAALAAFTAGLARQVSGSGVNVSLFCLAAASPRIGQNTRSRGIGRWIGDAAVPRDATHTADALAETLIDGIHNPRFILAADPADSEELTRRWSFAGAPASPAAAHPEPAGVS